MELWNRKNRTKSLERVSKWNKKSRYFFAKTLKNEAILMGFSVIVVLIIIMGSSYAVFSSLNGSENYNKISVGNLDINYDDSSEGYGDIINLTSEYPISDEKGMSSNGYKFNIVNSGSLKQFYSIRIAIDNSIVESDNCSDKLIDFNDLKISINNSTPVVLGTLENYNYVASAGTLLKDEKKDFEIKMWIKDNANNNVLGKHFHGKVIIEAENTTSTDYQSYFEFNTSGGSAIVSQIAPDGLDLSRIDIPKKYGNYDVTGIENDAFINCINIKVLNIPNTVPNIKTNTFVNCTNLTDVYIDNSSNNVTIEPGAFLDTVNIHYSR